MTLQELLSGPKALAGAVHNVDRCRTPVFIYAGASPFTLNGEQLGSRNEFILTIQDVSLFLYVIFSYADSSVGLGSTSHSTSVHETYRSNQ